MVLCEPRRDFTATAAHLMEVGVIHEGPNQEIDFNIKNEIIPARLFPHRAIHPELKQFRVGRQPSMRTFDEHAECTFKPRFEIPRHCGEDPSVPIWVP
jgi:hypothetical protein